MHVHNLLTTTHTLIFAEVSSSVVHKPRYLTPSYRQFFLRKPTKRLMEFIATEDYPITSNIGYYPGCVDYLDQEMVFSHVNEGTMNLGDSTTAAFTLFEEMGTDVSYLGRDFLKCCGHDQKWQGLDEVFEKLKAYNQRKIHESGIDTLVSSCALNIDVLTYSVPYVNRTFFVRNYSSRLVV